MTTRTVKLTTTSLNRLLNDIISGDLDTKKNKRFSVEEFEGLYVQVTGTKNTGKKLKLIYRFRPVNSKNATYLPIGNYINSEQCIHDLQTQYSVTIKNRNAIYTSKQNASTKDVPKSTLNKTIGDIVIKHHSKTISSAINEYIDTKTDEIRSSTMIHYRITLDLLDSKYGKIRVADFSKSHMKKFVEHRQQHSIEHMLAHDKVHLLKRKNSSNSAVNNAIGVIKQFFNYCIEQEYSITNPAATTKKHKYSPTKSTMIKQSYVGKYAKYLFVNEDNGTDCGQTLRLLRMMLYTGARGSEIRTLQNKNICPEKHDDMTVMTITEDNSKTKREANTPLSSTVLTIIHTQQKHIGTTDPEAYLFPSYGLKNYAANRNYNNDGKDQLPMAYSTMYNTHNKIKAPDKLNFPQSIKLTPHGMRHLFISYADALQIEPLEARLLTSHSPASADVHQKVYNHFIPLKSMHEATCRMSSFLNNITGEHGAHDHDDYYSSFRYWKSKKGIAFAIDNKLDFESWFALAANQAIEEMKNSGNIRDTVLMGTKYTGYEMELLSNF